MTSKGKVRALYKVSWYSWTMCFTTPKASALALKEHILNEWCESGNQFSNEKPTQDYRIPSQNGAGGAKSNHLDSSCPIWSSSASQSLMATTQCLSARYVM